MLFSDVNVRLNVGLRFGWMIDMMGYRRQRERKEESENGKKKKTSTSTPTRALMKQQRGILIEHA